MSRTSRNPLRRDVYVWLAHGLVSGLALSGCSDTPRPSPEVARHEPAASSSSPAEAAFAEGEAFDRKREVGKALARFDAAAAAYAAEGRWDGHVRSQARVGAQRIRADEFDAADSVLARALETGVARLGESHPAVAEVLTEQGRVALYRGQIDAALAHFERALRIRTAAGEKPGLAFARLYNLIGEVHYRKIELDEALALHDRALSLQLASGETRDPDVAATHVYRAQSHWLKGDHESALASFDEALALFKASFGEDSREVAAIYANIGSVYWAKSDFDQAISFYEKALALEERAHAKGQTNLALIYHNIAISTLAKGEPDRTLALEEKALPILLQTFGEQNDSVAEIYLVMGEAYVSKGELDRALELFKKALGVQAALLGGSHPDLALSHHGLGGAYLKKKDFPRSLRHYGMALALEEKAFGPTHAEVAGDYASLAEAERTRGNLDRALFLYQRSLHADVPGFTDEDPRVNPPTERVLSEERLLEALDGKAQTFALRAERGTGGRRDLDSALRAYEEAVLCIDRMRFGYRIEESKLFRAREAQDVYDHAIRTALRLYDRSGDERAREIAFRFSEKGKGVVLLEEMARAAARRFAGIPDALLEQERRLRVDLAFHERRLSEERLEAGGHASALPPSQEKVFALRQEYDTLRERLEADYPRYHDLKYPAAAVSVSELQKEVLDDTSALVEYFVGREQVVVFAVTRGSFRVVSVPAAGLQVEVERLRRGILERDEPAYAGAASRLYEWLLSPVADAVSGKRLIVVPDGPLSTLPFEALLVRPVTTATAELPFLLGEHAVSYAYSATLLRQTLRAKRTPPSADFVAFAPIYARVLPPEAGRRDLPASRAEVEQVASGFRARYPLWQRLLGPAPRVYLEAEASEARAKSSELGRYRYVHFATHGLLDAREPRLSGLLLAPDRAPPEDGFLRLGEIYNLDLRAELVVLSACETGLGRLAGGEGVIGLTRAFLYAGASKVLVSLWPVSDASTSELMVDLYDELRAGTPPAEALRRAKLRLQGRHPEYAKPYYWSAFVLVGG